MATYLGFDPGGNRGFGVALLRHDKVMAATVDTVNQAIAWAKDNCTEAPTAAGIDSLLHWSTGNGRSVDWLLRRHNAYKPTRLSVVSQNSLYGSMVIGGMGLAYRLREHWPSLLLNETHPKVLYYALTKQRYPRLDIEVAAAWLREHGKIEMKVNNDHEFDAAISAWSTKAAMEAGWPDLLDAGDLSALYPIADVHYYWPEPIS